MSVKHSDICIEFRNVTFSYGATVVLEDISFRIEQGGYVGLIGPNGGGKTTLLKIMLGILRPTSGSVFIFGHDVVAAKQHFDIAYVPQKVLQADVWFPATVREVVESGRTARLGVGHRFQAEDHAAVRRAMEMTDVTKLQHRLIGSLSGGERQRVFSARALAREPKILVLDEPTVGVDAQSKKLFFHFLQSLHRDLGMTIVLVSHEIDVVAREVNHVICLNRRLACDVSAAEFVEHDYLKEIYGEDMKYVKHIHDSDQKKPV